MMLQRTKAEQVQPVYEEFVSRFPSADEAAQASQATLNKLLKSLGLEWRMKTIRQLVKTLAKRNGEIPSSFDELIELPGVGDYVAAAFRTLHLNKSATLIDANIVRLYGRYFGIETGPETRRDRRFRAFATAVQPLRNIRTFGYALLDFTRGVCTQRPRCIVCPLRQGCIFWKKAEKK